MAEKEMTESVPIREPVEALAAAMFEAEHPERPWEAECAMLEGAARHYSWAPEFRRRAETALTHLVRGGWVQLTDDERGALLEGACGMNVSAFLHVALDSARAKLVEGAVQ